MPDYKPVSVPLQAAAIPLGRPLLAGSSDLPESETERAAPPPLFGLAPRGVCPASRITPAAVRSYRTFSPLPPKGRYIFCGTFRRERFDRTLPAVSRHAALWRPDFPPRKRGGYPSGKLRFDYGIVRWPGEIGFVSHFFVNGCRQWALRGVFDPSVRIYGMGRE